MDEGTYYKIYWGLILFVIICIISYSIFESYHYDKNCLKKVAKELCEDIGYEYVSVYHSKKPHFYCKEYIRSDEITKFDFLEKDIEECEKE